MKSMTTPASARTTPAWRFLNQFAVRVRVWSAVLLLTAVMLVPIPLLVTGQNKSGAVQAGLAGQMAETERSLLAASARIASSRANLLAYVDERTASQGPTPSEGPDVALSDVSQALLHLDRVAAVVPAEVVVDGATGELGAATRDLRVALVSYQELIERLHSARLADERSDALQLETQALAAADELMIAAERLVASGESARIAADSQGRMYARQWLTRAIVGYSIGGVVALGLAFVLLRSVTASVDALRLGAERLSTGHLAASTPGPYAVAVEGDDDLALVASTLNMLSANLARSHQALDSRVTERTAALNTRIGQLRSIIEVAQTAAELSTPADTADSVSVADSASASDAALQEIVDVIQRRLSLYYVGLFLVDESTTGGARTDQARIVLRVGTGEAGKRMVARGHRLAVGEGMVGWAVANAQARVALEVETDLVRVTNPDLPATRSEAAIPLRLTVRPEAPTDARVALPVESPLGEATGESAIRRTDVRRTVIGALTIQDDKPGVFDEETVELLQAMADLLAVMIQNARRYRDVVAVLETVHRSYSQDTREGWQRVLGGGKGGRARRGGTSSGTGYRFKGGGGLEAASGPWDERMRQAMATQKVIELDGALIVPISARGQVIGALRLQRNAGVGGSDTQLGSATAVAMQPSWTAKEIGLVQTIVEQLGLALDSARLYEDTQISAARERTAREVTDRMRATLDWDELMQTAVREIGRAVEASHVYVQWAAPHAGQSDGANGGQEDV